VNSEQEKKMPCDYNEYPDSWFTEIRPRILLRADNKCEECGVENAAYGYRDKGGKFHALIKNENNFEFMKRAGYKGITIVLTISHTDHNKEHNGDDNLRALCQKCHLEHDKNEHALNRKYGKRENQMSMF